MTATQALAKLKRRAKDLACLAMNEPDCSCVYCSIWPFLEDAVKAYEATPTTAEVWAAFLSLKSIHYTPNTAGVEDCTCAPCGCWRVLEAGLRQLGSPGKAPQSPPTLILDHEDAKSLLNGLMDALRDLHLDDDVDDVTFEAGYWTRHGRVEDSEILTVEVHR